MPTYSHPGPPRLATVPRKPTAFGYICLPAHVEDGAEAVWRQRITNFATVEGLSLLRTYVDDRNSDGAQFDTMVNALEQSPVTHLIVPGREHLGRGHSDAEWMVQHILSTRLHLSVHAVDDPAPSGFAAERRSA